MDEHPGKKIDLILDISVDPTLKCKLVVGAWKRLCINIIGNALKYTAEGHVMVSLKISQHKRRRPLAILTVSDTGIGMSRDFLENRLFRAFSQENELANGTGLGMSLVAKLVRGFNGKIKVQSAKGSGTTMTVSMPIDIALKSEHQPQHLLPTQHGLTIGFLELALDHEESVNRRRILQTATISDACCRLGAVLTQPEDADINFAFEADLAGIVDQARYSMIMAPTIVLCDNVMSAANMRSSSTSKTRERRLEFIAQPFGPQQLSTAIARCMESKPSPVVTKAESQTKAAVSREALRLQLSRRSHTIDYAMQTPPLIRPRIVRSGSAPPTAWSAPRVAWSPDTPKNLPLRTPPTPTPLTITVPETTHLNDRTQVFKDAFEATDTNGTAEKLVSPILRGPSEKLSLLLVDDNVSNPPEGQDRVADLQIAHQPPTINNICG